jgi:hypothetical protein
MRPRTGENKNKSEESLGDASLLLLVIWKGEGLLYASPE